MSGTRRVTLRTGDLIYWEPPLGDEDHAPGVAAVENGALMFQFGTRPWDQFGGPTLAEAVEILNGEREFPLPGRIWKCYDAATDRNLVNPALLEPGEDL